MRAARRARRLAGPRRRVERVGDRAVEHAARRPAGGPAERPHPMPLLGQVDELEVQGERACQRLELVAIESRDVGGDPLLGPPAGLLVGRERAPADRDEPRAEPLDEREELGTRLLGDDLAEQRAEQADLAGERVAGPPDARAGRFRRHGGEAGAATGAAAGGRSVPRRRARELERRRRSRRSGRAPTRQHPPTSRAPAAIHGAAAARADRVAGTRSSAGPIGVPVLAAVRVDDDRLAA